MQEVYKLKSTFQFREIVDYLDNHPEEINNSEIFKILPVTKYKKQPTLVEKIIDKSKFSQDHYHNKIFIKPKINSYVPSLQKTLLSQSYVQEIKKCKLPTTHNNIYSDFFINVKSNKHVCQDAQIRSSRKTHVTENHIDAYIRSTRKTHVTENHIDAQIRSSRKTHVIENHIDAQIRSNRKTHVIENHIDAYIRSSIPTKVIENHIDAYIRSSIPTKVIENHIDAYIRSGTPIKVIENHIDAYIRSSIPTKVIENHIDIPFASRLKPPVKVVYNYTSIHKNLKEACTTLVDNISEMQKIQYEEDKLNSVEIDEADVDCEDDDEYIDSDDEYSEDDSD